MKNAVSMGAVVAMVLGAMAGGTALAQVQRIARPTLTKPVAAPPKPSTRRVFVVHCAAESQAPVPFSTNKMPIEPYRTLNRDLNRGAMMGAFPTWVRVEPENIRYVSAPTFGTDLQGKAIACVSIEAEVKK